MTKMKQILGTIRLPFLILTPACVLLGIGTALWTSGSVNAIYVILASMGAVSAHISVNALNEYFDFKSGLDFKTSRTPFSGGSGILPENPGMAGHALLIGGISLVITGLVGVYFLFIRGLLLLPLGLAGLIVVSLYTVWFTRYPLLCLIVPGLGFGVFMVMGTDFVLTGNYSWTAFIASLVPFFLVSNLLLLNQFPDVEADKGVGRRHFPIVIGLRKSSMIYGVFLMLSYCSIIFGVLSQKLPMYSLMGMATLAMAIPAFAGAYRHGRNIQRLMPYLGLNVIVIILTPVLVAVGLLLG
jgi:1,4-dihydroxy-2-naphthoate octaprenyltransferase